jgi:uncharacterized protein YacL (UPF0231 family)
VSDPGSAPGMNTLWMDGEEVMVRANQLEFSGDEMEEGMSYYDEESLSLCGVEDFLRWWLRTASS